MKRQSIFLLIILAGLIPALQADISGRVIDQDGSPLAGVVVYNLTGSKLEVINNEMGLIEHLPRTLTDRAGQFTLKNESEAPVLLVARDMEDRFAFHTLTQTSDTPITITIPHPANLTGVMMAGPDPVANTEITLGFTDCPRQFRYYLKTKTNRKGAFRFRNLLPGAYSLLVYQDIPAIGCQGSILTHHQNLNLKSGDTQEIQIGGTDLPGLTGVVSSHLGAPLHGVWVQLFPKTPDPTGTNIWADVSDPNGVYHIYDLPEGEYHVRCLRRLAKNTPTRVMEKDLSVEIKKPTVWDQMVKDYQYVELGNTLDIRIDPEPFMPLEIGQDAPSLLAETSDGTQWDLNAHKGKVVVIHFYRTTSRFCMANFDGYEKTHQTLAPQVEVIGISLDKDKIYFTEMIKDKAPTHQQVYEGPASEIAKNFRVADVPSCIVIDQQGKIAQMDLFGATLRKFIQDKLLSEPTQ